MSRLGPELTAVLCLAMICGTVLAAMSKIPTDALQPIFSACITGAFALAMPNRPQGQ